MPARSSAPVMSSPSFPNGACTRTQDADGVESGFSKLSYTAIILHQLHTSANELRIARHHTLKINQRLSNYDAAGPESKLANRIFVIGSPFLDNRYSLPDLSRGFKVPEQKHVIS